MRPARLLTAVVVLALLGLQACAHPAGPAGWRCWEESRGLLTCERIMEAPR